MSEQQTYANHRRFEPLQHFVLTPILLLTWIATIWQAIKYPSLHSVWVAIFAFAMLMVAMQVRVYALKVQDRLIRLEETLRMQRLLPGDLQARLQELTPKQVVGLRFADDAELAERVREALDQHLSGEAIKKQIKTWRPDTFRV
jgi:isocitrate lyase